MNLGSLDILSKQFSASAVVRLNEFALKSKALLTTISLNRFVIINITVSYQTELSRWTLLPAVGVVCFVFSVKTTRTLQCIPSY